MSDLNQCYFVNFKPNRDGFRGWNSVYAKSLTEAKALLLKKCGQKAFNDIDWNSLKVGKDAERLDAEYEKAYAGCFN